MEKTDMLIRVVFVSLLLRVTLLMFLYEFHCFREVENGQVILLQF
jgi:hypothetical protein